MLRIHLFGHLRLFDGADPSKFAALPMTLPLWIYLLLHRTEPLARERLAYVLWPDESETRARTKLRRHLHDLRRALPPPPNGDDWLLADMGSIQWNPQARCWLDVIEFERLSTDPQRLAAAVALYTGDLLPAIYDDWIVPERERLRNLYFDNLDRLVEQSRSRRDWPRAIAYARQILKQDPLREETVRDLVTLIYESGDRARALNEYQRFERLVHEELGVAPMAETRALYDAIAAETLPRVAATWTESLPTIELPAQSTRPPSNLPAPLTTFIGREVEMSALSDLLCGPSSPVRLLTLSGPGGIGKTRLALEFSAHLLNEHPDQFPDGVFVVWLASIETSDLVASTIASTLGIGERGSHSQIDGLKAFLKSKRMLLVLDNFEQVVDAAPMVAELLAVCASLQIIVTSRALLHVYGEHDYQVQPLSLPNRSQTLSTDELETVAAIALFTARARAVNPNFVLNAENASAVTEICAHLDGLPLAIELAAARSKLFSPQSMLGRLESSLAFLSAPSRDLPERQQTLRATIDWSYNLLAVDEKMLYKQLAVFVGWFSLEAVESVCGDAGMGVLDTLSSLVDKSMLRHRAPDEPDSEPRFRMLLALREHAREQLGENGELEMLRERRAHYYLALAERADAQLKGPQQVEWLRRLETAHDNLRAVLAWAIQRGDSQLACRLGIALSWFWLVNAHYREGNNWLAQALSLLPATDQTSLRAHALFAAGLMAYSSVEYPRAQSLHEEGIALSEAIGDRVALAHNLYGLGVTRLFAGDQTQAEQCLKKSGDLYRTLNDRWGMASSLSWLSTIVRYRGDIAQAHAMTEQSLELYAELGDQRGIAHALLALAETTHFQGDPSTSGTLFDRCLSIARGLGDKSIVAFALTGLVEIALIRDDHKQAEEYAQEALPIFLDMAEPWQPPRLRRMLGYTALQRGDEQQALALIRESLNANQQLDDTRGMIACLVALTRVALARAQHEIATQLCGAIEAALQSVGGQLLPADLLMHRRTMGDARSRLAPRAFVEAWEAGRVISLDAALSLALGLF